MSLWNRSAPSPFAEPARRLLVHLDPSRNRLDEEKEMRDGLSAVIQAGPHLWMASDETAGLERFSLVGEGEYGAHRTFPLADLVDLPGAAEDEVDVEGMAWNPPFLWIVGSHSIKRSKPGKDPDERKRMKKLAKLSMEENRYLLARIPMADDGEGGLVPVRKLPGGAGTAARLKGDGLESQLMRALAEDKHVAPFMAVPGKDNGFDVEGLAISGKRLFLGLRGPVLRGWATILEVETEDDGDGRLSLLPIGRKDRLYRKHFLDLGGLGVREIAWAGDDLLILAGPTMDLDGPVEVFRWRGGAHPEDDRLVPRGPELERVLSVPYGTGEEEGLEHAEGMTLYSDGDGPPMLLVVYDAPSPHRKPGEASIHADLFEIPG